MATECGNKNHSAVFPEALPEWFIKLFTQAEDYVLDPFMGSGTTNRVAQRLDRNSVGIEISPEYYRIAEQSLRQTTPISIMTLINEKEYAKSKN